MNEEVTIKSKLKKQLFKINSFVTWVCEGTQYQASQMLLVDRGLDMIARYRNAHVKCQRDRNMRAKCGIKSRYSSEFCCCCFFVLFCFVSVFVFLFLFLFFALFLFFI